MPGQTTDFDWRELLDFIEDRRVIPFVGRELLLVPGEGGEVLLDRDLARRLAAALDVDTGRLIEDYGLNDVALAYLEQGGAARKIYSGVKALMDDRPPPVPEPLRKLASIRHLNLFVSTTFDSLLRQALDEVRGGGTGSGAYSLHEKPADLPGDARALETPYVYQLLGQLSPTQNYAVTDEDTLELIHKLQDPLARPRRLFEGFEDCHLLILGCGFPDWLARFFLRTVSGQRLFQPRQFSQFVADSQTVDTNLALFLRHCKTELFLPGTPREFVDGLHAEWLRRYPDFEPAAAPAAPAAEGPERDSRPVFLSYASEDRETVDRFRAALEAAGVKVWFDRESLETGQAWDREIQQRIGDCLLFMPFISRHARTRREGYFRKEWRWAIQRAEGIDESVPFLQPIFLDTIGEGEDGIPSFFSERHGARFAHGQPTAEFVAATRETVRKLRARLAGWE